MLIDVDKLRAQSSELGKRMLDIQQNAYTVAGRLLAFGVWSLFQMRGPRHLRRVSERPAPDPAP